MPTPLFSFKGVVFSRAWGCPFLLCVSDPGTVVEETGGPLCDRTTSGRDESGTFKSRSIPSHCDLHPSWPVQRETPINQRNVSTVHSQGLEVRCLTMVRRWSDTGQPLARCVVLHSLPTPSLRSKHKYRRGVTSLVTDSKWRTV